MRILFCRSNSLISWLIRLITWSSFSHVVLLDPDGIRTVEATWPRVKEWTLAGVMGDNHVVQISSLPCANPEAAMAWARSQVGKPYDLLGIFGFLLHEDMHSPNRWWCSDLVAEAFEEGGTPLFREGSLARVDPQHLWLLPGA